MQHLVSCPWVLKIQLFLTFKVKSTQALRKINAFLHPTLICPFLNRILTRLLEVSDDPQVIAVAAHDIGEYVRHYPRGKRWAILFTKHFISHFVLNVLPQYFFVARDIHKHIRNRLLPHLRDLNSSSLRTERTAGERNILDNNSFMKLQIFIPTLKIKAFVQLLSHWKKTKDIVFAISWL